MLADLPQGESRFGLGRSLVSAYFANAVNGVLGVISVPLGVHYLGATGYGIFSIYSVLASYISFVDLGVTKNFVRLLSAEKEGDESRRNHLATALGLYLVISSALIMLFPFIYFSVTRWMFPVSPEHRHAVSWIVICAVAEYIIAIPSVLRQMLTVADERFDLLSRFNLLSGFGRFVLMGVGFAVFKRPEVAVGLVVSCRFVDWLLAGQLLQRIPKGLRPTFHGKEQLKLIRCSSLLSVAQLFQSTTVALGSILANRYLGLASLGHYRAAFDLANKVWFISNGVGSVMFPRFVRVMNCHDSRARLATQVVHLLNVSWSGYLLLALLGCIAAPVMLPLIGIDDKQAIGLFMLMLPGVCINAHSNLSYVFLQSAGQFRMVALLSAAGAVLMLSVFLITRPWAGVYGLGLCWLIGQPVYAVMSDTVMFSVAGCSQSGQHQTWLFKLVVCVSLLPVAIAPLFPMPLAARYISAVVTGILGIWTIAMFKYNRRHYRQSA